MRLALLVVALVAGQVSAGPILFTASGTGATGSTYSYTAPVTGTYFITAAGAQGGGASDASGGPGAQVSGRFDLTAGTVLKIIVGQQGLGGSVGGGGGGASFVVIASGNVPLLVAAGGGGAGAGDQGGTGDYADPNPTGPGVGGGDGAGGGGGGFTTDGLGGGGGGLSFLNGGFGGLGLTGEGDGGYGGGGGGGVLVIGTTDPLILGGGGGGGGYDGGGGGTNGGGGGGLSFIALFAVDPSGLSGSQPGDGFVSILAPTPIPEPATLAMFGALALAGAARYRWSKAAASVA